MATKQCGILSLPNEILSSIFNLFSTRDLVLFAPTCHHIHDIVLQALQQRLQTAAGLDGHLLYLECGPPAAKSTTSKVFCTPLGTPGLQELVREVQDAGGTIGHLGRMSELYSRFRPVNKEPDFRSVPRPHPAGDIPGSNTYLSMEERSAAWKPYTEEPVTRSIHVDADTLFSQLETFAYLGRRESTRGLLCSIQDVCEGIIRVWREWLARQCEIKHWTDGEPVTILRDDDNLATGKGKQRAHCMSEMLAPRQDKSVLWLNTKGEHVGIKFRVKEKKWRRETPVLVEREADLPVSYIVELEEVLVRSTHLLLKLEESKRQIVNETGKAMIFGSYLE